MKKYLIITAGGSGTRMGASVPKQFIELSGKAVLELTIEQFRKAVSDIEVFTVLPKGQAEYWKEYCCSHNFICRQTLVEGGITRFHSVKAALDRIPATEKAVIAVHDGVRPFVSTEMITRLMDAATQSPAVVPILPVTDTVKCLDPKDWTALEGMKVDRSVLFGAQTPQIFDADLLREAYRQPFDTSFTDDASVVERTGARILYLPGEKTNIKLTTKEDLSIARMILNGRNL